MGDQLMIRYVWQWKDGRKIYKSLPFVAQEAIELPYAEVIYVNILQRIAQDNGNTAYKVKLYYHDGTVYEGWTSDHHMPISLINDEELFDGRFNQ
jgi:uncharacterized protein YfaA (DUF2138 family)